MVQLLRPWNFKIAIRHGGRIAVYLQIAHALIEEIRRGRLAPGSALPGTRELAESLIVTEIVGARKVLCVGGPSLPTIEDLFYRFVKRADASRDYLARCCSAALCA